MHSYGPSGRKSPVALYRKYYIYMKLEYGNIIGTFEDEEESLFSSFAILEAIIFCKKCMG